MSDSLRHAAVRYKEALPDLCRKHGLDLAGIKTLEARYGNDRVHGRHFTVTVETVDGKRSVDRYIGVLGKRAKKLKN